jgi:hypothetical protein
MALPDTSTQREKPAADTVAGAAPAGRLDETMLAMDVVDTLRHADQLVERELASDERAVALKQRLRDIYRTQGIDVPDRILDEGVASLEQNRFVYQPTPPSFARNLALAWATRGRWGRPVAIALLILILAIAGWWVGVHQPAQRALIAERQELSTGLPADFRQEMDRLRAATTSPDILGQGEKLAAQGNAAAKAGSLADARANLASLRDLRQRLAQAYTVRIVSRPGTPSGVWRVPSGNARARNFYLIVEAVDANGKTVPVRITSEEDGRTATVNRWGLRVTPEAFEQVRQAKQRSGVIDDPVVGTKRAGELDTRWSVATTGGAILSW